MANTIKTVIQFRRDTTVNWALNKDVVPASGEPCFDIDLGTLKIGDGVKTYGELEPINGAKLSADGKSIILKDGIFKLAGFDSAEVGAQPRVAADGSLEWVVPSNEAIAALQTAVAGLQTSVKAAQDDIADLKAIVGAADEGAGTLLSRVEGLENKMDGTGEGSVDAKIDAKINAWAKKVTDNGAIDTVQELFNYVAAHGGEFQGIIDEVAGLKALVGEGTVDSRILAAVDGKVDKVEGMGLSSNDFTDSLLAKLEAIENNAQVNVIEKISVAGSILDIVNKTVEIPVAGPDRAGVVKSSTGANMVNIANDGTMSVKKISTNSLFVPIGDELVLDGGSASKDAPVYSVRIGNMGCNSISDAVACADNGDIVTLQEDVNMGAGDNDHLVVKAENVTIDLAGKVLTANGSNGAVKVEGGMTTLDGAGTVQSTLGSDKYSMAVWCESGTVVINDGIYKNETDNSERGTDLIYASGTGCIEINGGVFEAAKPEWTLNVKDADYKAGTAKIIVKGGKFKNFDPANNKAEGEGTNFVADGYKSVKEGDYYVVKPI